MYSFAPFFRFLPSVLLLPLLLQTKKKVHTHRSGAMGFVWTLEICQYVSGTFHYLLGGGH